MNDLIEKMKNNRVMTCLLTKEEKDCIESAGDNIQCYYDRGWEATTRGLCKNSTYRINADYQPEPKVVRCEIKVSLGQIRYLRDRTWTILTMALNDPNFIGALDKNGIPTELRRRVLGQETPAEYPKYVLFASK